MRTLRRFTVGIGVMGMLALAAGFAPRAEAVYATGGTVTNYDEGGTNWTAHIFTNTAAATSIVFSIGGTVEYLVVAGGGGGGGYYAGGGGGAGGLLTGTTNISGTFPITVGVGGAGVYQKEGLRGTNSSAFGLTAKGGGGGGKGTGVAAPQGDYGSGGGGGGFNGGAYASGATGTVFQGNNGGQGYGLGTAYGAGGGGGAGFVGQNGSDSKGGDGGTGVVSSISGVEVTYSDGGGGGSAGSTSVGGSGGGGVGKGSSGGNGGAATGYGGGGGGSGNGADGTGGAGGAGIVIVRYVTAAITVPVVITLDATDKTTNSATLNGTLAYLPDGQTAEIRVYWGTNDAGPNAAGWMHTNVLATGVVTAGASYSYPATSLSTNYSYYYRYYGTNTAGSGELWGDVKSFQLLAFPTDLGLAVYGYPAGSALQWQNSVQGTSWSDVTNETNWHLRVTKAMYTATPYYRVKMIMAEPGFAPVYSSTAKLTDKDAVAGTVFLLR